ncbi:TIGR01777 family oxidoreductase [Radiobacillus sp. PE A8.2]|uniref:TIGR01777 family oxidoreductase n=1 Tax=Radiobacillus sp. PE A8.2 TaxID=3380349 RepID=UPI00388DCD66
MNIAITGGTGFVGQQLTKQLVKQGHHVYILTRSPEKYTNTSSILFIGWLRDNDQPVAQLPELDAIVNLAGDSLFGYWTKTKKQRIIDSRISATENVLTLINSMDKKPSVLINASAVGFYGTSKTAAFTEKTTVPANDFLATVTTQWEQTARKAEREGIRTVLTRFGVILGNDGALPLMTLPFKLMIGGKVGSGDQWMSWIHIDDVVGLIIHAIHDQTIQGPLNATAPHPVQNKQFSKTLAEVLNRPYWLPAPAFAIRTFLGEMSTLILDGQAVYPEVATDSGYSFKYPKIEQALQAIYAE